MLLGQINHDLCIRTDFVPSIFVHVDVRSGEKRKLDRYFQTTATKRKRLETVARGQWKEQMHKLCVAFKMY